MLSGPELSRLSCCELSDKSCEALSSVLCSQSSSLRHLDLRDNHLQDSGVQLLSTGLKSPQCQPETLSVSGCALTEEACSSLASALSSNPSHLRELDLIYNHPGGSGEKLLSAGLKDPHWRLDTLRISVLSCRVQMFCYWEVEWRGGVSVSVGYRGIRRKGNSRDCLSGYNDRFWSLICSDDEGYYVRHNNTVTSIRSSSVSHRVSVFVDCPAGTVSFYRVSDSLIHLHTFNTTFTQPLSPGFTIWSGSGSVCVGV